MDMATTITVRFPGGRTDEFTGTLKQIANRLIAKQYEPGLEPLLLELEAEGTKLFYSAPALYWYISGERSFDETIQALHCDALYRNKADLETNKGYQVEKGSLWLRRGNNMILVNDDEFVTCNYNDNQAQFEQLA